MIVDVTGNADAAATGPLTVIAKLVALPAYSVSTASGSATVSIVQKSAAVTIGTSTSYQNKGNTIANATDGNPSTYFDGPTANGNWVGLDLGTSTSISQIALSPRSGYANRMAGGKIQISATADFSSGVTTVYTIASAPKSGSLTTITLTSPVTARYTRYLSPNGSYGNISGFEVLG